MDIPDLNQTVMDTLLAPALLQLGDYLLSGVRFTLKFPPKDTDRAIARRQPVVAPLNSTPKGYTNTVASLSWVLLRKMSFKKEKACLTKYT